MNLCHWSWVSLLYSLLSLERQHPRVNIYLQLRQLFFAIALHFFHFINDASSCSGFWAHPRVICSCEWMPQGTAQWIHCCQYPTSQLLHSSHERERNKHRNQLWICFPPLAFFLFAHKNNPVFFILPIHQALSGNLSLDTNHFRLRGRDDAIHRVSSSSLSNSRLKLTTG